MPLRGMTGHPAGTEISSNDFYSHAPAGHDIYIFRLDLGHSISTPMPLRGMTEYLYPLSP